MNGGIFLSVKDLMILSGSNSYHSCWRRHKALRMLISKSKRRLTIMEYCRLEDLDFTEVLKALKRDAVITCQGLTTA